MFLKEHILTSHIIFYMQHKVRSLAWQEKYAIGITQKHVKKHKTS